jgi:hypothetical protein
VKPAAPVEVSTPVGVVKACDAEILGVNADQNSLQFSPAGVLTSLKTIHTGVRVVSPDQVEAVIEPLETTSLVDMDEMRTVPMQIEFGATQVKIIAGETHCFDREGHAFATFERARVIREACASCSGCDGAESC